MTKQVNFCEAKDGSTALWFKIFFICFFSFFSFKGYQVYSFYNEPVPEKFPEKQSNDLVLNEYYSSVLSGYFNRDEMLSSVNSIRVVSSDSSVGRTYIFEYMMKDGSKHIGTKKILAGKVHYEMLPAQYEVHRIKKDYLSVLIETDGTEYRVEPEPHIVYRIYYMMRYGYETIKEKEPVAKKWKVANEKVKEKRLNYARDMELEEKTLQTQRERLSKMQQEMDKQIEIMKSTKKFDGSTTQNVAEPAAVVPAKDQWQKNL